MRNRILAVAAAVGLLFGGSTILSASAAPAPERATAAVAPANSVTGTSVVDSSLTGADVKNGSLNAVDLDQATKNWFTDVFNNTVGTAAIKKGAVTQDKLAKGAVDLTKLSNDVLADLSAGQGWDPVVLNDRPISLIGGSWATRATTLTEFTLPAGVWMITTQASFDRLDAEAAGYIAPTTDTYPQLTVRDGEGRDVGTIMGNAVSRAGRVELTGSSVGTASVSSPARSKFTVRAFGYNEDRSQFGSDPDGSGPLVGQFKASVHIVAIRIAGSLDQ